MKWTSMIAITSLALCGQASSQTFNIPAEKLTMIKKSCFSKNSEKNCLSASIPSSELKIECQSGVKQSTASELIQKQKQSAYELSQCIKTLETDIGLTQSVILEIENYSTSGDTGTKTKSRYVSSFELGYQRLNGYDDEGKSTGLSESGAIVDLRINGRWQPKFLGDDDQLVNGETSIRFGKTPTTTDKGSATATGFNDVTDAVDAQLKLNFSPGYFLAGPDGALSFGGLGGFRSRAEAISGNELSSYWGYGLEFNMYSNEIEEGSNALPRGRISYYRVKAEEFGTYKDTWINSIHAHYLLVEDKPFLVGIKANFGPADSDDYAINFSIRQSGEELLKFFGFGG
ncbi:hypothetical protein [Agarivorans sp. DSG3-1]|uniref:hypothetical protein n=1 Tax=Agarivorans sp. DSG3-1 TaxID=3342249 RepID=UPI00398F64FF